MSRKSNQNWWAYIGVAIFIWTVWKNYHEDEIVDSLASRPTVTRASTEEKVTATGWSLAVLSAIAVVSSASAAAAMSVYRKHPPGVPSRLDTGATEPSDSVDEEQEKSRNGDRTARGMQTISTANG